MFKQVILTTILLVLLTNKLIKCENESWDCETSSSKVMFFKESTVTPSPILYPGNVTIDGVFEITEDLPSQDLFVRLEVFKLEPRKMKIPCIENKGSCTYDVCNYVLPNNQEQMCSFGFCECPVKKNTYTGKGISYKLPKMGGEIFKKLLAGKYTAKLQFYNSESQRVYGSMCMNFQISTNNLNNV